MLFQRRPNLRRKPGPKRKPRKDPTLTGGVLRRWNAEIRRRFSGLKSAIWNEIVDKDIFGLRDGFLVLQGGKIYLRPREFQYTTDATKMDGFLGWLDEMIDRDILEVTERIGPRVTGHEGWQNKYIREAYGKGVDTTQRELSAVGLHMPHTGLGFDLRGPIHAPKIASLYSRSFDELKGISSTMSQQIGRQLARGFAEGKGPMEIAKMINDRVDKIGITRCRLLARTETAYARNQGAMREMEEQERIIGEEIFVQWETAGDDRVRDTHAERRGRVFKKDEAEELLGSPNCRCNLMPYIKSIQGEIDGRTRLPLDKREWPRDLVEHKEVETHPEVLDKLEREWRSLEPGAARWEDVQNAKFYSEGLDRKYRKQIAAGTIPDEVMAAKMEAKAVREQYFADLEQSRRIKYDWISKLPESRYIQEQDAVIEKMMQRGHHDPMATLMQHLRHHQVKEALRWVPYDILDLAEQQGVTFNFYDGSGRASAGQTVISLFADGGDRTIHHEFAHVMESAVFNQGKTEARLSGRRLFGYGSGFGWTDENGIVTEAQAAQLKKEFTSLISGDPYFRTETIYDKGVPREITVKYFNGAFIDKYEGRAYSELNEGVEWWAMNVERYASYQSQLNIYADKFVNYAVPDEFYAEYEKKALESSRWGAVQQHYPRIASVIASLFSNRIAGKY